MQDVSRQHERADYSAWRSSGALFLSSAFFLRLLVSAVTSSGRLAFDQAIFEAESVQIFHGLSCPAQSLFLGPIEKCSGTPVQLFVGLSLGPIDVPRKAKLHRRVLNAPQGPKPAPCPRQSTIQSKAS